MNTTGLHQEDTDEIFRCLADQHRRNVIEYLDGESTPVVLETLVQDLGEEEDTEPENAAIVLLHKHLPLMEEARCIEVDEEMKIVREGPCFDQARELLEVVK